jgi:hypothetical protein
MIRFAIACVCLIAVSSSAAAQKRALVLPVELGGFFPKRADWKREYAIALEERLRGARFVVVKPELTPAQAECHDATCMAALATAQNVDVVVAARVANDEQRLTSYHARVRVVERMAPAAAPAVRERERSCTNCTEVAARDLVATALSAALVDEPEPKPAPPVSTEPSPAPVTAKPEGSPPPVVPPSNGATIVKPPVERVERFTPKQKLIFRSTGIASGVIGLALIGQGIAEWKHNKDPVDKNGNTGCAPNCGYHLNTASGQAVFFSLGIAGVAAGVALSVLGWKHWPSKAVTLAPAVSPSGAHLQLQGSF